MNYLKGVYWDLDGTIANTELEAHLPAFNKSFKDFDIDWIWTPSVYINLLKVNGCINRISYYSKKQNSFLPNDLVIKIHERKQYYYLELIKKNAVSLKIGVNRLINELNKKGVKNFIVTSSSKKQVDILVKYLFKDSNPFEFIISSNDVEIYKPHPLPYLKAIKLSGIEICNSVVFEDSYSGLKSSLDAKLPTIHIHSNIPTVINKDIKLRCEIDSLGDEQNMSNVIKGPKLVNNMVDYSYLNRFLNMESNAED